MEPSQDVIDLYDTASQWLTRRKNEAWSAEDERAFQAWLQADSSHASAYQEVATTWQWFDHIPRPELASDAGRERRWQSAAAAPSARVAKSRRPSGFAWLLGSGRRLVPALATFCLVVGIVGWYGYQNVAQYRTSVHTEYAQTKDLALPDGSHIAVNMGSVLSVALYPRRREAVLEQGEAFFEVAPRDGEPFTVKVGNTVVRVVGTAFNVRAAPPRISVRVQHGTVEVRTRENGQDQVELLNGGDAVAVDPATGEQQRISSSPEIAGAWRHGQIIFRDAVLSDVADELSRYLNTPVRLANPGLGKLRLSGFASTTEPQKFLNSLPQLLAVSVQQLQDGSYRIAAR